MCETLKKFKVPVGRTTIEINAFWLKCGSAAYLSTRFKPQQLHRLEMGEVK